MKPARSRCAAACDRCGLPLTRSRHVRAREFDTAGLLSFYCPVVGVLTWVPPLDDPGASVGVVA